LRASRSRVTSMLWSAPTSREPDATGGVRPARPEPASSGHPSTAWRRWAWIR
jgi:hypothetical protein